MTLKPSRAFMGSFFPVLLYLAIFVIWMPNPVSMAITGSVLFLWLGVLLYNRNRNIDSLDKELDDALRGWLQSVTDHRKLAQEVNEFILARQTENAGGVALWPIYKDTPPSKMN